MFKRSGHIIIMLLLASMSLHANTWLVSTTDLVRGDTTFQTYYSYNSALQPVLISTKISVNNSSFTNYSYTEQQFENGQKVASSTFVWDSTLWQKSTRTEWLYENGLLKNRKELRNSGDNWAQIEQTLYSYDTNNKLVSEITQTYTTSWQNKLKTDYVYNGAIKEIVCSTAQGLLWQPYAKITIDSTNEHLVTFEEFDSIWHTRTRTIYNQNTSGQPLDETQQVFQDSNWINKAKRLFTYDENENLNGELLLSWKTEFWKNVQRSKSEIDTFEKITTYYTALYNQWLPAYRTMVSLNEEFLPNNVSTNYLFWGGDVSRMRYDFLPVDTEIIPKLMYGHQIAITYESHTNTPMDIQIKEKSVTVYPNPSPNGIFYVDGDYTTISEFWVYNLQGQLIKHVTHANNKTIDISELNKGIYLSKIVANTNQTFTTKLIKSH